MVERSTLSERSSGNNFQQEFSRATAGFLDAYEKKNKIDAYESDLKTFQHYLSDIYISNWDEITPEIVKNYKIWQKSVSRRNSEDLRQPLMDRRRSSLSMFLQYLFRNNYSLANGNLDDYVREELKKEEKYQKSQTPLTAKEVSTLLSINNPKHRAIFNILLSGVSASDLTRLKVKDIIITNQGVRESVSLRLKSRKEKRLIRLNSETETSLGDYLARTNKINPEGFLFESSRKKDNPITRQGVYLILKQRTEKLGLEDCTPERLKITGKALKWSRLINSNEH